MDKLDKMVKRIDFELDCVHIETDEKSKIMGMCSKRRSKLGKIMDYEIEIPVTPALAICAAVVICIYTYTFSFLHIDNKEYENSRIKYISYEEKMR
jgi:hypothetical protein